MRFPQVFSLNTIWNFYAASGPSTPNLTEGRLLRDVEGATLQLSGRVQGFAHIHR